MRKKSTLLIVFVLLLSMTVITGSVAARDVSNGHVTYYLTLLHNNDGESQVVDAGGGIDDFGGAARFKTVVDNLRWEATHGPWPQRGAKRGVLMVSSGDNFLAGPEFNAGLMNGVPFYDTIAMELIGYNAVNLGNHDFDFGPDVLADFIDGYQNPPPYVSANLDFTGEPRLQAYVDAGVIAPSTVVMQRGEMVGVIGLETPLLFAISSPRNVIVSDDLVTIVQAEVDELEAMGVNKIILASHLQSITNEIALVSELEGLDVVIAGGGDELLANPGDLLIPGDVPYDVYPMIATDKTGVTVPVVTTSGEYKYVGKLVVGFDKDGDVVEINHDRSGPVRVATGTCNDTLPCDDAVEPDPTMQALVVDPVVAALAALDSTIVGTSEVGLDGTRPNIRIVETNEGNLVADSLLWWAEQNAANYGMPAPDVGLQNGGGIRNNSIIPAGDISVLDTFDMVPFPNFVVIVPNIPRTQFKEILENAVSRVEFVDGRWAQISGFSMEYNPAGTAQIVDADGNVLTPGNRVVNVTLNGGTPVVSAGAVVPGPDLNIATIDFLANGGDFYPYRGAPFTRIGATYQQSLAAYIEDGLSGSITAAQYPEGGEGRIVELP